MRQRTEQEGDSHVFNLARLRRLLELKEDRTISWRELAHDAGLTKDTVNRMANNSTTRVDILTLKKLLIYFRAHGMPIGIGDLFRDVEVEAK